MTTRARILAPALRTYRGAITDPGRWAVWSPRPGDILVSTPPKSGTTWTQTMLAMLVNGGPDLPARVPVLSPWIDADIGIPANAIETALESQAGRRVVKTHAPADGFPIWEGVAVVAVYRHPIDVFFSLRKHIANRNDAAPDHPMLLPAPEAFRLFVDGQADIDNFDRDTLASLVMHYRETACSGRVPDLKLFHYADMVRDGRRAVAKLARAAGIDADGSLIERVAGATTFGAMKAKAAHYTPFAGTGFWKSDAGFFDSASSRKWEGRLSDDDLERYRMRITRLLPDGRARAWFENGDGATTPG